MATQRKQYFGSPLFVIDKDNQNSYQIQDISKAILWACKMGGEHLYNSRTNKGHVYMLYFAYKLARGKLRIINEAGEVIAIVKNRIAIQTRLMEAEGFDMNIRIYQHEQEVEQQDIATIEAYDAWREAYGNTGCLIPHLAIPQHNPEYPHVLSGAIEFQLDHPAYKAMGYKPRAEAGYRPTLF